VPPTVRRERIGTTLRIVRCSSHGSPASPAYQQALRLTRPPMLYPTSESDSTGTGQASHSRVSFAASSRPLVELCRPEL
jgi:hypothetical protein